MADTKISALSAGTAAPGDEIPVNRGGSNFKITAGDILKINGGTITADSPVLNLTQTWNNAAVTFTGLKFNATDTNSADDSKILSLSLDNNNIFTVRSLRLAGTQYYRNIISATQYSYYESVAANGFFAVGQTRSLATLIIYTGGLGGGLKFRSGASLSWGSDAADASSGTTDLFLFREAAGTLAQRNSTNAQTFRIYNTYTDATNTFERGKIAWESNVLRIGTEKGVLGGTARALELQTDGTTLVELASNGNSVRLFKGGSTNKALVFESNLILYARGNGLLQITNSTENGFDRLQFGGTTSSFPALKRSSTTLIARLADDSANAAFESASLKTDAPTGGTAATWKLGTVASVTPTSPDRTIEVDIGGTIYYLHAKTTND